uniref:RNase H type-1 domain-containing protein n=1 Tax=Aegilops tauschii TaxID=37682 RepID=M8AQA8_AEGTA
MRICKICRCPTDGAFGYILRSDTGEFCAAGVKSALQAEAMACLAAIEGAASCGVHRVILESDSLSLVQPLNSGDSDKGELGVLFREA